jgi:hypothetical protein
LRAGRRHTIAKFRRDLPYAIQSTDLPGTQILLNRHGMPLGSNVERRAFPIYERFPNLHVRLTPSQVARLCPRPDAALFDNGSAPWRGKREAEAYLERLHWLADLIAIGKRERVHAAA